METYAEPDELIENPRFEEQRRKYLSGHADVAIDIPIIEVVNSFNRLPYCFTMQSCFGHFLYEGRNDPHNIDSLPTDKLSGKVEYRIAYVAFSLDCCESGKRFLNGLNDVKHIDPETIQLCSPQWFREQQVNSFALQVEPDRYKHKDTAILDYAEALHVEKVRNAFFDKLKVVLQKHQP